MVPLQVHVFLIWAVRAPLSSHFPGALYHCVGQRLVHRRTTNLQNAHALHEELHISERK